MASRPKPSTKIDVTRLMATGENLNDDDSKSGIEIAQMNKRKQILRIHLSMRAAENSFSDIALPPAAWILL